jgi:signal transduction histidine kinase
MPQQHDLSPLAYRTIVFAPVGRDGQLIAELLERRGLLATRVSSIDSLCEQIRRGAGAAILSEEALSEGSMREILHVLHEQPTWSDFPLILLTIGGRVTAESERLRQFRRPLGNLFLLERPIRPETLLSTLEIALRGRRRQYQIRDQMLQYANAQEALLRSEKLAVTGRLAASIAHEINNPLEAVTNLLYLTRTESSPERANEYLAAAEQELLRVTEITKQTLRFYREPSRRTEIDVPTVVKSVLSLFRSRIADANITVQPEFRGGSTALASAGELRQILSNLIGNAIDAMRLGGTLRIRVSTETACRRDGTQALRLTIADSGSGIPQDVLPRIFEPFISTKGETGTGLGLWVADEIVKRNGWKILVRSRQRQPHQGTTFVLKMPPHAD